MGIVTRFLRLKSPKILRFQGRSRVGFGGKYTIPKKKMALFVVGGWHCEGGMGPLGSHDEFKKCLETCNHYLKVTPQHQAATKGLQHLSLLAQDLRQGSNFQRISKLSSCAMALHVVHFTAENTSICMCSSENLHLTLIGRPRNQEVYGYHFNMCIWM